MAGFKELDGDFAVVHSGGVFRQEPLYARNGFLFIKQGSGFIKVYANGSTSKPGVRVEDLSTDFDLWQDRLGKIRVMNGEGFKPLVLEKVEDGAHMPALEDKS